MNLPTQFDPARKHVRACEVCGEPTSSGSRCTNGRCAKCHAQHCTSGGATGPGHGRGSVATPFAFALNQIVRHKGSGVLGVITYVSTGTDLVQVTWNNGALHMVSRHELLPHELPR